MTKPPEEKEPLVTAAVALMEELSRYEKLTDEVSRTAVNSEKTLVRATRAVQDASECHQRIMEHVGALSAAMTQVRSRQENDVTRMADAARKLSDRAATFQSLIGRYGALADNARSLNVRASEIVARKASGADGRELLQAIGEILARADEIVARAEELAEAARSGDFDDLARSADALKQQMQSARNRITLAQRALAERTPS
jgi:hypothetical protein